MEMGCCFRCIHFALHNLWLRERIFDHLCRNHTGIRFKCCDGSNSRRFRISTPLSVSLSDIYSEQKVVMAGGILAFLGLLISALSDHFAFVFIGYGVIFGFGLTLTFTPSLIICTYYFHERRATALSLSLAGCGFATMILPYFFYYLISQYGLSGALIILSAFSLHYCVAGALYFKKDFVKKTTESKLDSENIKLTLRSRIFRYLRLLLKIEIASGIWIKLFLFSFILNMMGSGPVTTLLIDYSKQLGV
uniref:Putative monocarboxylate transporter n=1 Tax=Schistosoma mansoni TaxID=6183 RepID=A0A5K4ERN7_SCHMA